jgi:uncharacterized protein DUF5989
MRNDTSSDFEKALSTGDGNVFSDFWYFLRHSKKWWMVPVVILLALFAALMLASGTAVAPFIYTLF